MLLLKSNVPVYTSHHTFKSAAQIEYFVLGIINVTIFIIVLMHIIMILCEYKRYKHTRTTPVSQYLLYLGIIGSICYNICSCSFGIIMFGFSGIIRFNLEMLSQYIVAFSTGIVWHCAQINTYLFFLHRLYVGFKGTQYGISKKLLSIFIILLIIYFIFGSIYVILIIWVTLKGVNIAFTNEFRIVYFIAYLVQTVIDFLLTTSLLTLFIRKLFNAGSMVYDCVDARHRNNIFIVVTKASILGIIMSFASSLVFITAAIDTFLAHKIDIMDHLFCCAQTIQLFVAPLCLLFGFDFTKKWYSFYCRCCHQKIHKYYIHKVTSKSRKRTSIQVRYDELNGD